HAERHPAWLIAELDRRDLLGWHHRRIEDMDAFVVPVREPQLFLIGREADAVARAAMALHRPFLESGDLDAVQHLARLDVADFEAKQIVDVDEAERLSPIDRERTNDVAERTHLFDHLVRPRIRDSQKRA